MNRIAAEYIYTGLSAEPVRNGYVEYSDDGTIVSVGECADTASEPDFRHGALVPGFVNSHCHLELSHLKGKFVKGSGMSGFINQINELRDFTSVENKKAEAAKWMEILWKQGVSAMADISNCDDTFRLKSESPLYTRTFLEVFGTEPQDCASVIDGVRKLASEAMEYGLDAAPTPHACYTMSPQLVTAASAEGLALEVHEPPFSEHILLVHNVCLTQEALDYAQKYLKNVWWAVCPLSNIFIHNALPPIPLMRENGLRITVGTDSLSSNDTLDMVAEMYCISENFPDIPLGEIISWATSSGASFLKKTQLGEIAPGKKPGLVLIENIDGNGRLTADSRSKRII